MAQGRRWRDYFVKHATFTHRDEHNDRVDRRHGHGQQYGQFPVIRDRVDRGYAHVPAEVKQVRDRVQSAPELGVANFAAVRYRETGHQSHVEAHQRRDREERVRCVGEQQNDGGQNVHRVREHHALPVPETVLQQRHHQTSHGRQQVYQTP